MHVTTYIDAPNFLAYTQTLLERHEATNNLMLGVCEALINTPERYPDYYLWTVDEGTEFKVAALMTPPFNLALHAEMPNAKAMSTLARHFRGRNIAVPGVTGIVEAAHTFAETWASFAGGTWIIGMHMRVYELRGVIPPVGVPGELVQAGPEHRDLVAEWTFADQRESLNVMISMEQAKQIADRHIANKAMYLWFRDGEPVSKAAGPVRQTRHGGTVAVVYTPPEKRGHGYASAVVAGVSQRILDSGKEFCALFTDLANPTSNSIYQKIGYRSLNDFDELKFRG